jgi:hypothetical protein
VRKSPGAGTPPPPLGGWLFSVRYVDTRGRTASVLARTLPSAEGFAARVRARGGTPSIYRTRITRWTEVPVWAPPTNPDSLELP